MTKLKQNTLIFWFKNVKDSMKDNMLLDPPSEGVLK